MFYKIATRKLLVELMDFFGILRRTQIGTSTITVNQIESIHVDSLHISARLQLGALSNGGLQF